MSDLGAGIQRLDGWHCNEAEALIEVLIRGTAFQESKRNEVQFSLQNQYQLAVAANRPTGMHQTLKRKERQSGQPFHSTSAPAHTFQASGSSLTLVTFGNIHIRIMLRVNTDVVTGEHTLALHGSIQLNCCSLVHKSQNHRITEW